MDNEDQPVEGARVALLKVGYTNGNPRWSEVASTVTLDNGESRIPRVAAGRYLVRCGITKVELAPSISGNQTTYAAAYHPNVAEPSMAAAVDVRDDGAEISGIDIRVAPVRLFHVRGKFHAPSDRQAQVFLVEKSDPSKVFAESVAGPPECHFDFPGIPPGSYIAGGRKVDLNTLAVEIRPSWLEKARNEVVLSPVKFADELKFRFAKTYGFFASFAVRISNFPEGCYLASVRYGDRDVPDSGIEYSSGAMLEISIGSDGARVDGQTVDKDGNTLGGAGSIERQSRLGAVPCDELVYRVPVTSLGFIRGRAVENRRFWLIQVRQVQAVLRGRLTAFATFHALGLPANAAEYVALSWGVGALD